MVTGCQPTHWKSLSGREVTEKRQRTSSSSTSHSDSESHSGSLLKEVYDSAPEDDHHHDTVRKYFDPDNVEHSFLKELLLCQAARHGHHRTITHLIDYFKAAKSLVSKSNSASRHGVQGRRCQALDWAYDAQREGKRRTKTIKALLKGWETATGEEGYNPPVGSRFKTSSFMLPWDKNEFSKLFHDPDDEKVRGALDKLVDLGYLRDPNSNGNGGATE